MPRFRRRFFRRGPRPRTRWLALTPKALLFSANNTTDIEELTLEDASGVVPMTEFIGGTIVRTIMDLVYSPTYDVALSGALFTLEAYVHLGVFLTEDANPNLSTRWDPNKPHGDFMHREMMVETWYARDAVVKHSSSHGQLMHWDVKQKRRINENERLWISGRHFDTGDEGAGVGLTGRVLIQLP